MFGGNTEIPEELKEIVKHSSEAELTELVMQSLKEAMKDPESFAKAGNFPPMLITALKAMPAGDQKIRPMAQSMAKMLIAQIKHGQTPDPMSFISNLMDLPAGSPAQGPGQPSIPEEVNNLIEQSKLCKREDDLAEAEKLLRSALEICQRDYPESLSTCHVLNQLATAQLMQDNYTDAESNLKHFLNLAEKHLPANDCLVADSYFGLAMVRENQGKSADADLLYTRALSIAEKAYAQSPLELAHMLETLANFYEAQKLYRKSDPLFQRAISLREQTLGKENLEVAEQFVRYTLILEARGHFSEAEMWCYRALTVKHALLSENDPDLARNQALLASIYIGQEQFTKAEPVVKQSIDILTAAGNEDDLLYPLEIYARLLKATNRQEEAAAIETILGEYE